MKITKMILTAVVAMFAVATVSAQQTLNDVKAKYNEAVELINAKKHQEAIPALESAIDMGLDVGGDATDIVTAAQKALPACYMQYGLTLCRAAKFQEAIPVLNNAIGMGELYGDTRSVRNSRQLLSQAYMAMGADAFNEKNYAKAIEVFSQGYAANAQDTQLGLYLAESYAESMDYDNAFRVYGEIAALGDVHSSFKDASEQAKEKIEYYRMIQTDGLIKAGDTAEANRLLDEALTYNPASPYASLAKIQLATNAQQWSKVIEFGDAAIAAQTDGDLKSTASFLVGAAYQNSDNTPKAIEYFRQVVSGPYAAEAKKLITELNK